MNDHLRACCQKSAHPSLATAGMHYTIAFALTRCALFGPSRSPDAPRKPETGYAAVGIPRGDAGATGRAPYASKGAGLAIPAHALLAVLNGLWLLALGPLLGDLAIALDTSLAKAFGTLFEAPRVGPRGAATAFCNFWCRLCGRD